MNEERKDIFGNELTAYEGDKAIAESMLAGLGNLRSSLATGGSLNSEPFVGVGKDGVWKYGAEGTKVDPSSRWIPNLPKMQQGYIAWKDSKPVGLVLVSVSEPLPPMSSLRDVGAPWEQVYSMQIRCIEGGDEGAQVLFQNGSLGARRAVDSLATAITAQVAKFGPSIPVLRLDVRSYQNKKYGGLTYEPIFTVTGWVHPMTGKAIAAPSAANRAPEPAKAPEPAAAEPEFGNAGRRRRVQA